MSCYIRVGSTVISGLIGCRRSFEWMDSCNGWDDGVAASDAWIVRMRMALSVVIALNALMGIVHDRCRLIVSRVGRKTIQSVRSTMAMLFVNLPMRRLMTLNRRRTG